MAVEIRFLGNAASGVTASEQVARSLALVRESATATAGSMAKVTGASQAANVAMREQAVVVGGSTAAHHKHSAALKSSERGALAASGAFRGLGRSMAFASNAFIGGIVVVGGLKAILDATKNAQVAQEQLARSFKNAGLSWEANRKQVEETDKAMRRLGFTNVETETALARLIVTTKNAATAHKDLSLAADLARFRHISLEAATQLVIKAQIGMTAGLRRLGIDVQNTSEHVNALKKAHDLAAAAAKAHGETLSKITPEQLAAAKAADKHANSLAALAKLHTLTKNAALDYSKTAAGAADRVKASFESLAVSLGNNLLPAMSKSLGSLANWVQKLADSKKVHEDVKTAVQNLTGAFKAVEPVVVGIAKGLNDIVKATTGWKTAFEIIISLFLANKFLKLASAIRDCRLAMLLFGNTAPVVAGEVVGAEAAMAAGMAAPLGKVAAIRLALAGLPPVIGPIAILLTLTTVGGISLQHYLTKPGGLKDWVMGLFGGPSKPKEGDISTSGAEVFRGGKWVPRTGPTAGGPGQTQGQFGGRGGSGGNPPGTGKEIAGTAAWASQQPGAGTSYQFGGAPGIGAGTHTDCSGFVVAVLQKNHIPVPGRDTRALYRGGSPVSRSQLMPGDIVFFFYPDPKDNTPPNHVGIYEGGGYYIGDQHTGSGIVSVPMDWSHYYGARRYATTGSPTAGTGGGGDTSAPTWTTTPKAGAKGAAASLASQKASVRAEITKESTLIASDAPILGRALTRQLKAEVAALNAELGKAGKADMAQVRRNLSKLKADLAEGIAQATDVTRIRGMLKTLNDDLKNGLIDPGIEAPIAAKLKHLEALLRNHLLSPAQRKVIEAQIKAAGESIKEALKQAVDVKGIDTYLTGAINKIRDALGIGLKQLATPAEVEALATRIGQIRELLTHLLTPSERTKLEAELKADENTMTQGLDGLISAVADAKSRFDTAWADFKQGILDAFSAIQNPFTAAETFAAGEMGHYRAVTGAARAESAITKAAAGDPQAAQAAKLVHALADAWREYYAAIASGDTTRIAAATHAVEDAQTALDTFASDPGGLSSAAQSVLTNGQTVIDSVKYLGDEVLTAAKNAWDEKHKADAKAISDGLDDIAKKIREGKETPAQAWDEVVALLIAHGFTPAQAEQMAGPMLNSLSDIGGAMANLVTAINNLVEVLNRLAPATASSAPSKGTIASWNDYAASIERAVAASKGFPTVTLPTTGLPTPHLPTVPAPGSSGSTGAGPGGNPVGGASPPSPVSGGGGCFVAGTPVATPRGERPIETMSVGDEVLVWDFARKQPVVSTVEEMQRHEGEDERGVLIVELASGRKVETTPEHPFFTGEGWLPAGRLSLGSRVAVQGDEGLELMSVVGVSRGEKRAVYNLHVEHPDHNYFAAGCLVHNVKVPLIAGGGFVGGFDRGFDSIHALLRPGEVVLNQDQQSFFGGAGFFRKFFNRVGSGAAHLAGGGSVPSTISRASLPFGDTVHVVNAPTVIHQVHVDVHGSVIHERDLAVTVRDAMIKHLTPGNRDLFGGHA